MMRHVPLLTRTALRRTSPLRTKRQSDPVTASMRDYILRRDKACLMAAFDDKHVCRDPWGVPHAPWATALLSIEHVHSEYGMAGKRAPSDARHLVAVCYGANLSVPSKEAREFFRTYIAEVER